MHAAIRRRAQAAGYDETVVAQLGGHSLRAGFVTQAFRNGANAHAIMRQTWHTNPATVELYARKHTPLSGTRSPRSACRAVYADIDTAAAGLGNSPPQPAVPHRSRRYPADIGTTGRCSPTGAKPATTECCRHIRAC